MRRILMITLGITACVACTQVEKPKVRQADKAGFPRQSKNYTLIETTGYAVHGGTAKSDNYSVTFTPSIDQP